MSYAVRAPVSDRAVSMPRPDIAGKCGDTQRRSSRFTSGAMTWNSHPAHRIAECDSRVVHPSGQRVEIQGEGLTIRCGNTHPRDSGREIGKNDHPPESFGALLDETTRLRPLSPQR